MPVRQKTQDSDFSSSMGVVKIKKKFRSKSNTHLFNRDCKAFLSFSWRTKASLTVAIDLLSDWHSSVFSFNFDLRMSTFFFHFLLSSQRITSSRFY